MVEPVNSSEKLNSTSELPTPEPRKDRFSHISFYESDSPFLAGEARRLHALGYLQMGFVEPTAIDETGMLHPYIDKARGDNVQYYLAYDDENKKNVATMRKIAIPEGEDQYSLPAMKLCQDSFHEDSIDIIKSAFDKNNNLIELAALAGIKEAGPLAVYEVLRAGLHDGIPKSEVWLFSLVAKTHERLVSSMGEDVFTVLGKDVKLDDPRVSEDVRLRPLLFDTTTFLDTLLGTIQRPNIEDEARMHYIRSLIFFSEGLSKELMSEDVSLARKKILSSI